MRIELDPQTGRPKDQGAGSGSGSDENEVFRPTDTSSGHEKAVHPTRNMTFLQKLEYYSVYYLPKALAILLIAGVSIFLILYVFLHKNPEVNILFVNHHQTDTDRVEETLLPYLEQEGLRTKNNVEVNASVNMDLSNFITYEAKNAFDVLIASRTYMLLFADEDIFSACAASGYFRPLEDFLTEEELSRYDMDAQIYGREEGASSYLCGLTLTKETCPWLNHTNYDRCCVGVLYSDPSSESINPLLSYILNYRD